MFFMQSGVYLLQRVEESTFTVTGRDCILYALGGKINILLFYTINKLHSHAGIY